MLLYHYAPEDLLEVIASEGLKPGADCYKDWYWIGPQVPKEHGVWFSTDQLFYFNMYPPVIYSRPNIVARVNIDRRNTKLISWIKVLRSSSEFRQTEQTKEWFATIKTFYVYLGSIPAATIISIDRVVYALPDGSEVRTWGDIQEYKKRTASGG